MKFYINREPVVGPWGGGNMWVQSIYSLLTSKGHSIVSLQEKPDVIFIAGINSENGKISAFDAIKYKHYAKSINHDVKLIFRVNENDARKNTQGIDDAIKHIALNVDHVVFVSNWLKDYFFKLGIVCKSHSVIYNGVNKELFSFGEKMNNNKINIVTHHWSDNLLKGFDVYDQLDDWISIQENFTFTYIGRDRGSFKNTKIVKPLFGKLLSDELKKYDVYVSASRHDPGPNHIIESISCGIPTFVHIDGGGCVEFAGKKHTYDNFESLVKILLNKNYSINEWTPETWEVCIDKFLSLAKDITNEKYT